MGCAGGGLGARNVPGWPLRSPTRGTQTHTRVQPATVFYRQIPRDLELETETP